MLNKLRFKYLMITTHPPQDLQKIVGGAQWNRPLNQMTIMKMKFHNTSVKLMRTKKLKKNQIIHQLMISKKNPENSQNAPLQEKPINTRGEKYNLRPNPNPNYSDTYRY